MTYDELHPSDKGDAIIAGMLVKFLRGTICNNYCVQVEFRNKHINGSRYHFTGNIFLIAHIFHFLSDKTRMNVLHIFRKELSLFWMVYLQSTIQVVAFSTRMLFTVSVLVPGFVAELFNIPSTAALMPSRHSPVETNWSISSVNIFFSNTVSFSSLALAY